MLHQNQKLEHQPKKIQGVGKLELAVRIGFTRVKMKFQGVGKTAGAAETLQKVENGMADCFTLLKRITRLNCVNSEVKSVHILPNKGCLNWIHGIMSESPWKSH